METTKKLIDYKNKIEEYFYTQDLGPKTEQQLIEIQDEIEAMLHHLYFNQFLEEIL
jgi:hypothetical protein